MSAWIVSKEHIDVLVRAREAYSDSFWTRDFDRDETGRMLWRENLRSVAARYPNDESGERPGPIAFVDEDVDEYSYVNPGFKPTPGEVFQAVGCYEYQSCETDDWEETDAHKWCRELVDVVASSMYEGPWGWNAEKVRERRGLVSA